MTKPWAEPAWWEFAVRGVMLRGTVPGRTDDPTSDGAAVVAIHGGPDIDGGELRHVLAPLAARAKLVAPNLPGHGRSDLAAPQS